MSDVFSASPTGLQFKLGRRRPVGRGRAFRLGNYLKLSLPTPPAIVDYSAKALAGLSQIYANDVLGDCTAAGPFHIADVLNANAGDYGESFTTADVINFYSATCGYIPGDAATDNGGDEETVLNYWQNNGLVKGRAPIAGWMRVNGLHPIEYRTAIYKFENLMFGCELPDEWIDPFPSAGGFVWDSAGPPNPDNGHCFIACGYKPGFVQICSWGLLGWISDAAIAKYATSAGSGELYTVLSRDSLDSLGKSPLGFDWSQLVADFDSMGGTVR